VDDQERVREALQTRLEAEPDLKVVGEAPDGAACLRLARKLHPDVVLMDVVMPGVDGLTAAKELQREAPKTRVVMLSMHDGAEQRERARRVGAAAFVGKHEHGAALLAAIRSAAAQAERKAG